MAPQLKVLTADQEIGFNAVLDNWTAYGDTYAAGYRRAAELLLRLFVDDPAAMAGERDRLVLPILYLFRHYLEIRFKDLIVMGDVLLGKTACWPKGHDLADLAVKFREICASVPGVELSDRVSACVSDLDGLDPNSTNFRYPRDNRGRPIFDYVVIGLKNLRCVIDQVGNELDGLSSEMAVRISNAGMSV